MDGREGDPDGDGLTNRQEMLAGTLPLEARSRLELRAEPAGVGVVRLTVAVPAGRSATIQVTEDLSSGAWQNVRSVLASPDGGPISVTDTFTSTTRYYRLVMP